MKRLLCFKILSFIAILSVGLFNFIVLPMGVYWVIAPNQKDIAQDIVSGKITIDDGVLQVGQSITLETNTPKKLVMVVFFSFLALFVFMRFVVGFLDAWIKKYYPKNKILSLFLINYQPADTIVKFDNKKCRKILLVYSFLNAAFIPALLFLKFIASCFVNLFPKKNMSTKQGHYYISRRATPNDYRDSFCYFYKKILLVLSDIPKTQNTATLPIIDSCRARRPKVTKHQNLVSAPFFFRGDI